MTRLLSRSVALGALVFAAGAGGATALLAGGGSGSPGSAGDRPAPAATGPSPVASPIRAPVVRLALDAKGHLPVDAPLRLTVAQAELRGVRVVDDTGAELAGAPDATGWTSATTPVPTASYTVTAAVADAAGHELTRTLAARAAPAKAALTAVLSPGDDDVVGVGQPVIITFSGDVAPARRAATTARLAVESTPAQPGAWRWTSAREVHWRPRTYWRAGTKITAGTHLDRLDLGGGTWGEGAHTARFAIGAAQVSTADVGAHTLTVRSGGSVVRVLPMSAGQPRYPTHSGVHLALEKAPSAVFDSATIGIPTGSSGAYKQTVAWDVRLTYSGTFVHSAPWSVADQGRRNVSHGCLNLSPADARWFYDFTRRGDVVDIRGSGVPPLPQDPGSVDWNL